MSFQSAPFNIADRQKGKKEGIDGKKVASNKIEMMEGAVEKFFFFFFSFFFFVVACTAVTPAI